MGVWLKKGENQAVLTFGEFETEANKDVLHKSLNRFDIALKYF